MNERFNTTTQILPCYIQRTPPQDPSDSPSSPPCRRHPGPPWSACRLVLLRLSVSASPPPSPYHHHHHHLLLPPIQYHHRPPAVATTYPAAETSTKAQPASYLTSTNSPLSYTAPARLWQPVYSASGLLHPTPHRQHPSIVPSGTHPGNPISRFDHALVPPTHLTTFPVAPSHTATLLLTSASRLLALPPLHTRRNWEGDRASDEKGSAAGERSVWAF